MIMIPFDKPKPV